MTATAATKTIRLCVNEKRLPEILRNSFTSWQNVLKELLQNARRAGATEIRMSYEAKTKTLEINDDGRGISNMQDLLHIAESGWDADLKAEEQAYGIGFMSALYAGEEITVESGTERLSFSTKRALSFHDLPIETLPLPVAGTRVRLREFSFDVSGDAAGYLRGVLQKLVNGFPTPIIYNGELLERPYAMGSGKLFAPISVGHAHLTDIHDTTDGKPNIKNGGTSDTRVYLQGFLVAEISPQSTTRVSTISSTSIPADSRPVCRIGTC